MVCTSPDLEIYRAGINSLGFTIVPNIVAENEIESAISALAQLSAHESTRGGQAYAARNLLASVPLIAQLAASSAIRKVVDPIVGRSAVPVRGILFDKIPEANWNVAWHQDQFIPVAQRRNVEGFAAWSVKKGVIHVRPPQAILEQMLTLRIHLDDCGPENGALKVVPSSHLRGLLSDKQILELVGGSEVTVCSASRGSVLAMRPLLLHSSSAATAPSHRRVIHLEFAHRELPNGMEWHRWASDG